jgi:hypothetical protein
MTIVKPDTPTTTPTSALVHEIEEVAREDILVVDVLHGPCQERVDEDVADHLIGPHLGHVLAHALLSSGHDGAERLLPQRFIYNLGYAR